MKEDRYIKNQALFLRKTRKVHKSAGIILLVFFFIVSVSGLLLGWKKNSNGLLLPETKTGTTTEMKKWLPLHQLESRAKTFLIDSVSKSLSAKIDRIDVRKNHGVVKFTFKDHYYEIQMDGATGEVLHVKKRWSDLLENIHDGSVLDKHFGTNGEVFKLIYASIMGLALLLFTLTGFWLWYGTLRLRKKVKHLKSARKQVMHQEAQKN